MVCCARVRPIYCRPLRVTVFATLKGPHHAAAATGLLLVALTIPASTQRLPDGIARTSPPSLDASEPLQCWLRTTASAVRVGEVFSVVLTCALLNSSATVVVPDTTKLDAASLQLAPFDVIGATHVADIRSGDRSFF